jgi:two-component system, NtrC family, nitrogen regulation response regulator NtrX
LQKEVGNVARVAEKVGLERTHLYRKLKQLGIKFAKKSGEDDTL